MTAWIPDNVGSSVDSDFVIPTSNEVDYPAVGPTFKCSIINSAELFSREQLPWRGIPQINSIFFSQTDAIDSSSAMGLAEIIKNTDPLTCSYKWGNIFPYSSRTEPVAISSTSIENSIKVEVSLIRNLVERGYVNKARAILKTIGLPSGFSEEIDRLKLILAPPQVRIKEKGTGQDPEPNMRWLRENAHRYEGKWLALKDGRLLGQNSYRTQLRKEIGEQSKGALFVKL